MKNAFLKVSLTILAIVPLGLAAKDTAYIALASTITPTSIAAICQLADKSKSLQYSKQEGDHN
ncbi:hypothetical protein [Nostoc parmelioides]|uniref:Uncharacterized protein n=1 Tax=Nostoc parmelioides FACHB-3921 TaxID=2692909 RepID=A0ABR8BJB4_9NOSO|nr:hypothetical protein [Nostoc parmelioides]MBD2252806.1 hypothetical protein [Nostoc parmelioides FACHB-3921]